MRRTLRRLLERLRAATEMGGFEPARAVAFDNRDESEG
jgi:hypothetical protein